MEKMDEIWIDWPCKASLDRRGIPIEYMERTIIDPDLKHEHATDKQLEHRLKVIPEKENRVFRVIVNVVTFPIRIVTTFFDRKMKGKLWNLK